MDRKTFILICLLVLPHGLVQAQKIVFSPQWTPHAQFVGYYMALEKGFYKELGLDVRIEHSSQSNSINTKLQNGQTDIISLQLIDALVANQNGADLVNLMQISQNNALTIVMQPGYTQLEQLHGKRVAGWKSGFCIPAVCLGEDHRMQFEWVYFTGGINLFTSNAVDAILAMSYNELFTLMHCGKRIKDKNIVFLSEYEGYNIPEDGVYCKRSFLEEHPEVCRLFVEATRRGWEYADAHREEALEVILETMKKEHMPLSRSHQEYALEKILELRIDKKSGQALYRLTPEAFQKADQMLIIHGYISKSSDYNQFVPIK